MRLVFLGTGAMIPTKERNLLSVALEYKGNILLFDTGESVQKQIKLPIPYSEPPLYSMRIYLHIRVFLRVTREFLDVLLFE